MLRDEIDEYHRAKKINIGIVGVIPDTRSVRVSNKLRISIHHDIDVLTIIVVQGTCQGCSRASGTKYEHHVWF